MKKHLEYQGYIGTVNYYLMDQVYFGRIFGISDLITYEGNSIDELERAFQEAVIDYLETCKAIGKTPEKTSLK